MKTLLLFLAASLGFSQRTTAQLFAEAFATHLMPVGGLGTASSSDSGSDAELLNFGTGTGAGLALGGTVKGPLGWELRLAYMPGKDKTIDNSETNTYTTQVGQATWTCSYTRIEPAVRITAGQGALQGYLAAGPSIGVAPVLNYTSSNTRTFTSFFDPDDSYVSTNNDKEEYTGGMGWGGFGALGITWTGQGAFGLFAEATIAAMDWKPKEQAYTSSSSILYGSGMYTGSSISGTLQFEDHVSAQAVDRQTTIHLPMSTWGLRAGVRFVIGTKRTAE